MPSYVRAGIRKCARIRALSDAQQETKTNGDIISIAASNLEQTVDALTKDLVEAKGYKLQKAETVKLTKETAHADE